MQAGMLSLPIFVNHKTILGHSYELSVKPVKEH